MSAVIMSPYPWTYHSTEYLLYILVLLLHCRQATLFSMLSKGQMYVLNAGDNVSLQCEFYMERFNLFYNPILWQKVQYHEVSELNIMGNIKPPFDGTDKFKVSFSPQPPRFMLGLSITNLSLEDSGNYTCDVRAPGSALLGQVTHRIFVRAPVDSIAIYEEKFNRETLSRQPVTNTLSFMEDTPKPLQCVVTGGNPPPDVTITVGRRDVTTYFHVETLPRLSGDKGFRLMQTTTVLWTDSFVIGRQDDGKRFKCRATVAGLGTQVAITRIQVNYAPIVSCQPALAYLWDKNVHLSCTVRASPSVTALFWMLDNNGTIVSEGEVINEYWIINIDHGSDGLVSKLYLRQAKPESFRTYTIVAENSVAVTTKTIELTEMLREPKPRPQTVDGERQPPAIYKNTVREHNGYIFIQNHGYRLLAGSWIVVLSAAISAQATLRTKYNVL